jgi:Tfp pilus assembly protein FimT
VEVLMSVVLMAISLALALPSYRDMVEKRQLTNGAEQVAAFINSVQGMAMRTNQSVTVKYAEPSGGDWCIGAYSGTSGCDCDETRFAESSYCKIEGQSFVIDQTLANGRDLMHSIGGTETYTFNPVRGFSENKDTLTMEMRSRSGDFRLNLLVNEVGRVTLCSTDDTHAIPGYKVCAGGGGVDADTSLASLP